MISMLTSTGLYKVTDKHANEFPDAKDRQQTYLERYGNGGTRNYTAMAQRIEVDECFDILLSLKEEDSYGVQLKTN